MRYTILSHFTSANAACGGRGVRGGVVVLYLADQQLLQMLQGLVAVADSLEGRRRVESRVQDRLDTPRMCVQEARDVVDLATHGDPFVSPSVVLETYRYIDTY